MHRAIDEASAPLVLAADVDNVLALVYLLDLNGRVIPFRLPLSQHLLQGQRSTLGCVRARGFFPAETDGLLRLGRLLSRAKLPGLGPELRSRAVLFIGLSLKLLGLVV